MKFLNFKSGAIASALTYALCWQLPLVLAGLGLGSFSFAIWFIKYRWVFLVITFVFLGLAWYKTFKGKNKPGRWSTAMLYGTTALSIALVLYSLVTT